MKTKGRNRIAESVYQDDDDEEEVERKKDTSKMLLGCSVSLVSVYMPRQRNERQYCALKSRTI